MPDPTSQIQAAIERHRRELAARDRRTATELARTYAATWRQLNAELQAFLAADGPNVEREARIRALLLQAETEYAKWARWADRTIDEQYPDVVAAAEQHAAELANIAIGRAADAAAVAGIDVAPWNRINHQALQEMVAATMPSSPVRALFDQIGPRAAGHIAQGLRHGIAEGWNPRKTASAIRDALGGDLNRALTIARTETMRAYRSASILTYGQNADLVTGWIWTADIHSHPGRTCPACWAMHGTRHPISEPFGSHPRCRCSPVPELKDWADIHPALAGLDNAQDKIRRGADEFAALPDDLQRQILGPTRHDAYARGDLTIDDNPHSGVVVEREDPVWGKTRTTRPIRDTPSAQGHDPKTSASAGKPGRHEPRPGAVGSAITPTAPIKGIADHTTSIIDEIHKTPRMPAYRLDGSVPNGAFGVHSRRQRRIGVDPTGPWPHLTAAHEIGHAISRNVLPANVKRAVLDAINQSDFITVLRDALLKTTDPDLIKYRRYLLKDEELWARAYSQWVATRSGDQKLLAELRKRQTHGLDAGQWPDDDFAPIAAAIEDAFRKLGWLP